MVLPRCQPVPLLISPVVFVFWAKCAPCRSIIVSRSRTAPIGGVYSADTKLSPDERLALRQEHSVPVIGQLQEKLASWKSQLLPKHPLAQALGYIQNQWGPLTAFTRDGAIPIHNNLAEQQMKRIALARKNFLMVGNERGGQTAAILSSLTSTCQRHRINPELYLTQLLVNLPDTPVTQLDAWLPDCWQARQEAEAGKDAPATAPPVLPPPLQPPPATPTPPQAPAKAPA